MQVALPPGGRERPELDNAPAHGRDWRVTFQEEVFAAFPWLRVLRQEILLPDGRKISDFHSVWIPDCSIVYAVTNAARVVVERQYRHGPQCVSLMLPAGAIEADENPLAAAKRELLEETGYAAARWDSLGAFSVNGNYGCGRAHLFVAGDAKRVQDPCSEDLEETEILEMGHDELTEAVYSGEIKVLAVAALICMVNLRRRREASEG